MDEILSAFAKRAADQQVEIVGKVDGAVPSVLADATRVRQVLNNLVENAFKFTPEGGEIEIAVGAFREEPDDIRISVSDTGRGILPEELDKVFERLHQVSSADAARSGLGLGLSICRELVMRQEGRIWVESEEGQGSVFHFTLPIFSVTELVRPAVEREGHLRSEFGILRVQLAPKGPGPGPSVSEPRRWLSEHLRRLAFYAEDVLLPSARDEELFLLAGTDEAGMRALSERVARNLAAEKKLAPYEVSVDARVERVEDELHLSPEEALAGVSRQIESLIADPEAWATAASA